MTAFPFFSPLPLFPSPFPPLSPPSLLPFSLSSSLLSSLPLDHHPDRTCSLLLSFPFFSFFLLPLPLPSLLFPLSFLWMSSKTCTLHVLLSSSSSLSPLTLFFLDNGISGH
ncbi:hypothetical protein E1963_19365, partial [Extibacter muris]